MRKVPLFSFALALFLTLCSGLAAVAQTKPAILPDIFPPSPNAASLGKYGEIPVSLHTGVPNISVPLFNIKSKRLNLSVSLSYHAGGQKVEDQASGVGLGWTLNAGGTITRTMRGLPDEQQGVGFFNGAPSVDQVRTDINKSLQAANGLIDTQPDLFYFNFGGYSGKFYFDQNGNIYSSFKNKFRIKPPFGQNARTQAEGGGWSIVTEDGTEYIFTATESQTSSSICTNGSGVMPTRTPPNYVSAWYLTKIISPDLSDQITFEYGSTNVTYTVLGSETKYTNTGQGPSNTKTYCDNKVQVSMRTLGRIMFANGYLDFDYDVSSRTDLQGAKALKRIGLYTNDDKQINEFVLDYSYFVYETGLTKLKLDKVQEQHSTFNPKAALPRPPVTVLACLPPYTFDYFSKPNSLNSNNRYAQDHWGYYNGIENASATFIPERKVSNTEIVPGAKRNPTLEGAKTFNISRMTYPTGGYSEFTYELHDAIVPELPYTDKFLPVTLTVSNNNPTPREFTIPDTGDPNNVTRLTFQITTSSCGNGTPITNCNTIPPLSSGCASVLIEKYAPSDPTSINGWKEKIRKVGFYQNYICPESHSLEPGRYRLRVDGTNNPYTVILSYYEKDVDVSAGGLILPNKRVGGLRIQKIITAASGLDTKPVTKTYSYRDNQGYSTGKILSVPVYHYSTQVYYCDPATGCGPYTVLASSSLSNVTLGTTAGSPVSYTSVTVSEGENAANGQEVHTFSFRSDLVSSSFPFGPSTSFAEFRGLQQRKTVQRKFNNVFFRDVEDTQTSYVFNPSIPTAIKGLKVGFKIEDWTSIGSLNALPNAIENYAYNEFEERSNWLYSDSTKHKTYSSETVDFVESLQTSVYNLNNLQLEKQIFINSDGVASIIEYRYPADYPSATGAIAEMRGIRNMQNTVIERLEKVQKPGNSPGLIKGTLNSFGIVNGMIYNGSSNNTTSGSRIVLEKSSQTELNAPSANLPIYIEQQVLSYDNLGNIVQVRNKGDDYTSYIWGYGSTLPIAEVQNATTSQVQSALNAGGLSTDQVAGLTDPLAIRNAMNNLQSQLSQSLVTHYTYIPYVGIESSTTPAKQTIYYEYDNLKRLKSIKDHNKNLVKAYNYNFNYGECTSQNNLINTPTPIPTESIDSSSYQRIFILGNSITKIPARLDGSGWDSPALRAEPGGWGMAASVKEKDYVHILTERFKSRNPAAQVVPAYLPRFEHFPGWTAFNFDTLQTIVNQSFGGQKPDLVIVRLIENVDDGNINNPPNSFKNGYNTLLNKINEIAQPNAKVILTTSFWEHEPQAEAVIRQVATERGLSQNLVELSDMRYNPLYRAANDPASIAAFPNADFGVNEHPGDMGMLEIADRIWGKLTGQSHTPVPSPTNCATPSAVLLTPANSSSVVGSWAARPDGNLGLTIPFSLSVCIPSGQIIKQVEVWASTTSDGFQRKVGNAIATLSNPNTFTLASVAGPSNGMWLPSDGSTQAGPLDPGAFKFWVKVTTYSNITFESSKSTITLVAPSGGAGCSLTKVRVFPRTDCCSGRTVGAQIQVSTVGKDGPWTTVFTIPSGETTTWREFDISGATGSYKAIRYLSPTAANTNVAELEFYSGSTKLTGTPFGDSGGPHQGNPAVSFEKAFDGNTSTYYDALNPTGGYVGLELTNCAPSGAWAAAMISPVTNSNVVGVWTTRPDNSQGLTIPFSVSVTVPGGQSVGSVQIRAQTLDGSIDRLVGNAVLSSGTTYTLGSGMGAAGSNGQWLPPSTTEAGPLNADPFKFYVVVKRPDNTTAISTAPVTVTLTAPSSGGSGTVSFVSPTNNSSVVGATVSGYAGYTLPFNVNVTTSGGATVGTVEIWASTYNNSVTRKVGNAVLSSGTSYTLGTSVGTGNGQWLPPSSTEAGPLNADTNPYKFWAVVKRPDNTTLVSNSTTPVSVTLTAPSGSGSWGATMVNPANNSTLTGVLTTRPDNSQGLTIPFSVNVTVPSGQSVGSVQIRARTTDGSIDRLVGNAVLSSGTTYTLASGMGGTGSNGQWLPPSTTEAGPLDAGTFVFYVVVKRPDNTTAISTQTTSPVTVTLTAPSGSGSWGATMVNPANNSTLTGVLTTRPDNSQGLTIPFSVSVTVPGGQSVGSVQIRAQTLDGSIDRLVGNAVLSSGTTYTLSSGMGAAGSNGQWLPPSSTEAGPLNAGSFKFYTVVKRPDNTTAVSTLLTPTTVNLTAPTGSGNSCSLTKVRIYPRADCCASRVVGAQIQVTTDGTNWTTVLTVPGPVTTASWLEFPITGATNIRSIRYVALSNAWTNVAELEFYSGTTKLTGTTFGSTQGNQTMNYTKAFDGNVNTYFEAATIANGYLGMELTGCPQ